jgi:hypothetical protein
MRQAAFMGEPDRLRAASDGMMRPDFRATEVQKAGKGVGCL